jgi:hypothetical protein
MNEQKMEINGSRRGRLEVALRSPSLPRKFIAYL